jgi:hypothetical protein
MKVKSISEVASEILFEQKCEGTAIFRDGFEIGCSFSIQFSRDSKITGEISFLVAREKETFLQSLNTPFGLRGVASRHKISIELDQCLITETLEKSYDSSRLKCKFEAQRCEISSEEKNRTISYPLIFRFGLANIREVFNIQVETSLGKLRASQEPEMVEYDVELRKHPELILASSWGDLLLELDGPRKLGDLLEHAKFIVRHFLSITSLAQVRWHNYVYVCVCKPKSRLNKNNFDDCIYVEFINPRASRELQPMVVTENYRMADPDFILNAWKGYSPEAFNKYGFDLALEWYIASQSNTGIHLKMCDLLRALDLLVARFDKVQRGDYILDVGSFQDIRTKLDLILAGELNEKQINPNIQDQIRKKLEEINHRPFSDRIQRMLSFWGIKYDDLEISIDGIIEAGNELKEMGPYTGLSSGSERMTKAYLGLLALLTRLFLAVLDFRSTYYDPVKDSNIDFSDVCTRVRIS